MKFKLFTNNYGDAYIRIGRLLIGSVSQTVNLLTGEIDFGFVLVNYNGKTLFSLG